MPTKRNDLLVGVVVGVTYHDESQNLRRAVVSALALKFVRVAILVVDSSPRFDSATRLGPLASDSRVMISRGGYKTAFGARNALIRAANRLVGFDWLLRLDADDSLLPCSGLGPSLERCRKGVGALLGGNVQLNPAGSVIGVNRAHRSIAKPASLMRRLAGMCAGKLHHELPSCNLILRLPCKWRYPAIGSAEDHFLLTKIILTAPHSLRVDPGLMVTRYTVGGLTTMSNKSRGRYVRSRAKILKWAMNRL